MVTVQSNVVIITTNTQLANVVDPVVVVVLLALFLEWAHFSGESSE